MFLTDSLVFYLQLFYDGVVSGWISCDDPYEDVEKGLPKVILYHTPTQDIFLYCSLFHVLIITSADTLKNQILMILRGILVMSMGGSR